MEKTIYSKMSKHLQEILVEMREKAGLTQRDLAKILKCTKTFVWRIENGERRVDVIEFYNICKACGQVPNKAIGMLYTNFER